MTKYYMKFCPIINGKPQPDVETEHSSHSQSKTAMLDQATALVKSGFKIIRSKGHAITLVNGDTEIRLLVYERKDICIA